MSQDINRMLIEKVTNLVNDRPWWVLFFSFVIAIGLAKGLPKMTFSNDYRDYFSNQNPQLEEWERLQKIFAKSDNVFIALSVKEGSIFNNRVLSVLEELTEEAWTVPYATRVDSLANFQNIEPLGEDDILISNLYEDAESLTPEKIQEITRISTKKPQLVNRLVNPQGTTSAINIEVRLSQKPREEIAEISEYAYLLKAKYSEKYPELRFHITGSVPYNYAMTNATKKDMASLMPAMYLLILMLFVLFTKSIFASLAVCILMVFSIVSTMGASAWAGVVLMAPSMSAPTIVMTMAVANAVHIAVTFFRYYQGETAKRDAIKSTIESNWSPVIITNLTTAIGFLTMNLSDVPPYRDLGNMVAGGLVFVVIFSILLLPAMFRIFPIKAKKIRDNRFAIYTKLAEFIESHFRLIIIGFVFLVGVCSFGISRLELNDKFVEWMDTRYEFRVDSDFINENLTGLYRLDWGLESKRESAISNPGYLYDLDRLTDWSRVQHGVVHVHSMSDIFKELNQKFHGGDPAYYKIPQTQELAAQLLLIYELSLPMGLDLNNMTNVSKSSTRFVIRTANLSTQELLALEQDVKNWLEQNSSYITPSEAASTSILFANIAKRNISALLGGTISALFLISLLLIFPLRSLKYGLLSIVPNLLPAAIAFGIWGLLVGRVGLAISVVVGMTMGVVVDDTVHFMTKYLRNRRSGNMSPTASLSATFEQVGPALLGTTLMLALGFALLSQSGFEVNQQMGALTSLVIVIAFIADFLLLTSLIMLFDRKQTSANLDDGGKAQLVSAEPLR